MIHNRESNRKKGLKPKLKRICRFCENNIKYIDYREERKLFRFINEQGKILPRRTSGNCAKHQRQVVTAIKRARHLAILPYVADSAR